ncbi:hypothetical protein ACLOJK_009440 [Asimina triloba]
MRCNAMEILLLPASCEYNRVYEILTVYPFEGDCKMREGMGDFGYKRIAHRLRVTVRRSIVRFVFAAYLPPTAGWSKTVAGISEPKQCSLIRE